MSIEERGGDAMNGAEARTEAELDAAMDTSTEVTTEAGAEALIETEPEKMMEADAEAETEAEPEAGAEAEPDPVMAAMMKAAKESAQKSAKIAGLKKMIMAAADDGMKAEAESAIEVFMEAAQEAAQEAAAAAAIKARKKAQKKAEKASSMKSGKKAAKKADKKAAKAAAREAAMEEIMGTWDTAKEAAEAAVREVVAEARQKAEKKAEEKAAKEEEKRDPVKAEIKALRTRMAALQQTVKEQGLPIIVLVEGWAAAGKGSLINELIQEIDPRNYNVVSPVILPETEVRYPFLYTYAKAIPENGKIMFYDSGWMENCVRKVLHREITTEDYKNRLRSVTEFERQLRDGGYLVLKLFLDISEKEQHDRIFALRENFSTEWRVSTEDMWQYKEHKTFEQTYRSFMEKTGDPIPWHVLDGSKRKEATRDALKLLLGLIDKALTKGRYVGKPFKEKFPLLDMPKLSDVDLSPALTDEEYEKQLKKLQKRLGELHNEIYRKKIPVILCYEGWDAAGKGGNIRRIARPLDPRGCDVIPIASPEPHEKNRQYLWRFWTRLPRSGHVCIFDRTWYGRVMVERLEGFCSENDWKRAYNEINEFERQLTDWGAVVLKFWIHIDQDTQLQRFNDRQNTPEKAWKLTEEDWRNREKWPLYEEAIDEMLEKTSTKNAPWFIIESNDKKYARIKALSIVIDALEKACAGRLS
ncbi:MAG: hypothetical protein IJI07_08310 [Flexilinea sp.]|nr:hypothetical protein [Flexilinea sp.]